MRLLLTRAGWATKHSANTITHRLDGIGAGWAEVEVSGDAATLRQDTLRSFPLYYTHDDGELVVSDSIDFVVDTVGARRLDIAAAEEFRHLGFVTGGDTLHPGIRQVQAGEEVMASSESVTSLARPLIGSSGDDVVKIADADALFTTALRIAFERLLDAIQGRQVVVPLSGGLDSRLISVILRDLGYDNVVTFTYGVGETTESLISRTVASDLGQRWLFIPYAIEALRQAWTAQSTAEFLSDTYAGASLPHIQDWFALRELRNRSMIDTDAVILAGHTVVGNMHDDSILDHTGPVPARRVSELIIAHHAVLQPGSARAMRSQPRFLEKLNEYFDLVGYDGSPTARLIALEGWNLRERQTKYINNSVRNYEHFGYGWALPMLDEPVLRAWESLAPEIRRNRVWYEGYVARRYAAATGKELSTYVPTTMSPAVRNRVNMALSSTGLATAARRIAAARAWQNHPMAFQAFLEPGSQARMTRTILRGGNPFGLFADAFLHDRWGCESQIFRS